jgi:hypothetical protein
MGTLHKRVPTYSCSNQLLCLRVTSPRGVTSPNAAEMQRMCLRYVGCAKYILRSPASLTGFVLHKEPPAYLLIR